MNGVNGSDWYGPRTIRVLLPCNGDMVSESNVDIRNIEESIDGHDILTFGCPACGGQHQSLRFG